MQLLIFISNKNNIFVHSLAATHLEHIKISYFNIFSLSMVNLASTTTYGLHSGHVWLNIGPHMVHSVQATINYTLYIIIIIVHNI